MKPIDYENQWKYSSDDVKDENVKKINDGTEFERELTELINRNSKENDSDTPDYILAGYIQYCLLAFTVATKMRDRWWGFRSQIVKNGHGDSIQIDCSNISEGANK